MYTLEIPAPPPKGSTYMGHWGPKIHLSPRYKELVSKCDFTQKYWDGYNRNYLSPAVNSMFGYEEKGLFRTRLSWGEWGPEHLDVPGNACGLDLCDRGSGFGCVYHDGVILLPHNVDCMTQAYALVFMFTSITYTLELEACCA